MSRGLDFAGGRPGAQAIRDAGYGFVVRYLTDGGPGLPGKLLLPDEIPDYRAHGIDIVSNWETTADRMRAGYGAGAADAAAGLARVLLCGGPPDRPIYFSADWDATPGDQFAIDAYLRGAASVLGPDRVGVYGGYWVVKRCLDNGTARWAWQTEAWSGGNTDPRIHIMQRNSLGYAWINGVPCDINETRQDDYGQWSRTGDGDMQLTDEITDAYGNPLTVADALKWICYHADLTLDQLGGAGTTGTGNPAQFQGWPQLGGRTIVDALAVIGRELGIAGFAAPDEAQS